MEDGPVFRQVDLVAAKHRVDALTQARLLGESTEQLHRLVSDAILGVVEINADRLRRQPLATCRVVHEERAEVQLSDFFLVDLQRLPRGARSQWQHSGHRSFTRDTSSPCPGWRSWRRSRP